MAEPASSDTALFHRGYYSGEGYTYKAHPEYFPQRLALVSLFNGQCPPALEHPFRLVELGCGQGVSLVLQAALHPHAQFCGIDLLPGHISHARNLAAAAGPGNASFHQADLLSLAHPPTEPPSAAPAATTSSAVPAVPPSLGTQEPVTAGRPPGPPGEPASPSLPLETALASGSFDLAISHGLLSWVAREVQQALWQIGSSCLRPGGLLGISYNAFPGQLSQVPFQHLVRSLQQNHAAGSASLEAAIAIFQELRQCGAGVFASQPALASLLQDYLPYQDPAYLPHEYNQQHWQPRFADAVIRQAAAHGLSYLASTSLPDACEGLLPATFQTLLSEQGDLAQRQLLRDLMLNIAFRRDVYARGRDPLWERESEQAFLELRILRLIDPDALQHSDPQKLFSFPLGVISVQGDPRWFSPFLAALEDGPRRLGDLHTHADLPAISLQELLQNLALLLEKGLVAVVAPAVDASPSHRLNATLARKVRNGAPYTSIAAPVIGSSLGFRDIDFLALDAHLDGRSGSSLAAAVEDGLRGLGRDLRADGRSPQAGDRRERIRDYALLFEQRTLPMLRRLAAIA